MRKVLGVILSALGAFLIAVALLAQFYAPGQLLKTPLDVNTTTRLAGTVSLPNAKGQMKQYPAAATSITHADADKSDSKVISWLNSSCLVLVVNGNTNCVSADDPSKALLSATTDSFATNRKTALAVNDPKYLPAGAQAHEGLVNKWPFESKKKTYPYWDGTVGSAVDAVYAGESKVDGVKVYVYRVSVTDAPAEVPGGGRGTYTSQKGIYVEPLTGDILNQTEHRVLTAADGSPVLVLNLAFTPAQQKTESGDAQDNVDQLNLVLKTVPLIGYLVGIPVLIIGLALLLLGRRERGTVPPARGGAEPMGPTEPTEPTEPTQTTV